MAYGIFRKVTTLEFFQHHFAKSGHGDGLLMTRQLISNFRQPPPRYLTRSVRRTSGFVLARHPVSIPRGSTKRASNWVSRLAVTWRFSNQQSLSGGGII